MTARKVKRADVGRLKGFVFSPTVAKRHRKLQAVSGKTRYLILSLLHKSVDGHSVSELAEILNASPSRTSHQLSILRQQGLIEPSRDGRVVTYTLAKEWRNSNLFS